MQRSCRLVLVNDVGNPLPNVLTDSYVKANGHVCDSPKVTDNYALDIERDDKAIFAMVCLSTALIVGWLQLFATMGWLNGR